MMGLTMMLGAVSHNRATLQGPAAMMTKPAIVMKLATMVLESAMVVLEPTMMTQKAVIWSVSTSPAKVQMDQQHRI